MTGLPFLPQPKPNRFVRKAARRRLRREHGQARDRLVARIHRLDGGKCRRCARAVKTFAAAKHELEVGHVDEWLPRSLGGDDLDEKNCLLLCAGCHLDGKHGKQFDIVALDPVELCRGPLEFPAHIDWKEAQAVFRALARVTAAGGLALGNLAVRRS